MQTTKRLSQMRKQKGFSFIVEQVLLAVKNKFTRIKKNSYLKYLALFRSKNGLVIKRILSYKMYLDISDLGLSRQLLLNGIREELQTEIWRKMIKPGMVIVEVGTNLGYYALLGASIVGKEGKVYAIEPVPRNFEIFKKNIRVNNYEGIIEPHCIAISDKCGVSKMAITKHFNFSNMFLEKENMSDWMLKTLKKDFKKIIKVKTLTLDKFLENKKDVDLIRMDVEGYEVKIIKGMKNTIQKSKKPLKLFIELHPAIFRNLSTMENFLHDLLSLNLKPIYLVNTEGKRLLKFNKNNLYRNIIKEHAPGLFLEKK